MRVALLGIDGLGKFEIISFITTHTQGGFMRIIFHLPLALALWLTSVSAIAAPLIFLKTGIEGVVATLNENGNDFTLKIVGGEIKADASTIIPAGADWPILLTITLKESPGDSQSDLVSITGSVHHEFRPHAETSPGSTLSFVYSIFQGDTEITFNGRDLGPNRPNAFIPLSHGNHVDYYSGTANANFVGTEEDREIFGWTVTLQGEHKVPEPQIHLLLLGGLCALGISINRQRI